MKKKKEYAAILSFKGADEMRSRIMNEKYVELVLDVYMSPSEFALLVEDKRGKSFKIVFL